MTNNQTPNQYTPEQIELIERWIVENVDPYYVPADEGNREGLIYNLVHLLREGETFAHYNYISEQDDEVKNLFEKYGREFY